MAKKTHIPGCTCPTCSMKAYGRTTQSPEFKEGLRLIATTETTTPTCECVDEQCPECRGACLTQASVLVGRVDMHDTAGLPLCGPCADDAMDSGVFDVRQEIG